MSDILGGRGAREVKARSTLAGERVGWGKTYVHFLYVSYAEERSPRT